MPSKSPAPKRWLIDIRHNIHLARSFIEGLEYEAFRLDTLRIYAVVRCLEIISEASRRLPPELKARHPEISWTEIAGAGNVYRHEYEDVAARRVWATARHDLSRLLAAVDQELAQSDRSS
ncbi:MAG: DUF86 domain-containing protein [Methylobacteriaceae bacterium]|nr:DUF86 domain-containing protein [Methylobacteriaceae bacterium]